MAFVRLTTRGWWNEAN